MLDQVVSRWSEEPVTGTDADPDPATDPVASNGSWDTAWASQDIDTIRTWYQDNTGYVGDEDELTVHDGTLATTSDGQVIDGMLIRGTLSILHDDVTVRDSVIEREATFYGIDGRGSRGLSGLTVERTTVRGVRMWWSDRVRHRNPRSSPQHDPRSRQGGRIRVAHAAVLRFQRPVLIRRRHHSP